MQINKKQAFTLVELIVVITILAILGTIAFMAFGGYSKNARDSRRVSDLNNITKSLELFQLKTGFYPEPSGLFTITYSGATVWTQGGFGDTTTTNVEKLDKKPIDPLTQTEYTYSVTNSKKEYQIAAIYEGDGGISFLPQTYAADTLTVVVQGNYNGKYVTAQTGSTTYILGVPSIITSDTANKELTDIIVDKTLVFEGFKNLPSSYSGLSYDMNGGFEFTPGSSSVLFEGDIATLTGSTEKLAFAEKLDTYYTNTNIGSTTDYVLVTNMDTSTDEPGALVLVSNFLSNTLGESYSSTTTLNSNTASKYPGCDTDDIVLSNGQKWSACNVGATVAYSTETTITNCNSSMSDCNSTIRNTLGGYFQWGRNDNLGNEGTPTGTMAITGTLAGGVGHSNFIYDLDIFDSYVDWVAEANSNLWGGSGTTQTTGILSDLSSSDKLLMQGPCASGYHVPTQKEWCNAITSISGTLICEYSWQPDTQVLSTLRLPLAGQRHYEDGTYSNGGVYVAYWTSTPYNSTYSYSVVFGSSGTVINPSYDDTRIYGSPVRCIKNN